MINKHPPKIFFLQLLCFIIILTISFSQVVDPTEKDSIIKSALQNGYNLSNPNDDFFLDICNHFTYSEKDVTLEYRQKYFYFPNNSVSLTNFQNPKRNNTLSCFTSYLDIKYVLINIAILIEFPLFIYQLTVLLVAIYINPENIFLIEPENQVKKNIKVKKNKNAKEFVEETNNNDNNNENNNEATFTALPINELNDTEKDIKKKDSGKYLKSNPKLISESNDEEDLEKHIKKEIVESKEKFDKQKEEINDYITFGLNQENNQNFMKAQEEMNKIQIKKQSKEEKLKDSEKVFNAINEERTEEDNNSDIIRRESNDIKLKQSENIIYSREEYFYLEVIPERALDRRSLFEIYLDLLNQCQFIFKFFCISFNIYEDRKLQVLYYTFKINLHIFFNIILTTNYVINKIFDNNNRFKDDISRSLFSCILTYFFGIFIYDLTNIKRTLIKRRKKIRTINFRGYNKRIFKEFKDSGKALCLDFFINKLKILLFLLILFSLFIMIYSFGFCIIYRYTQLNVLKCVIYSCIISQSAPFVLCWIPSFLRRMFIKKKKEYLLTITQLIESLFIP